LTPGSSPTDSWASKGDLLTVPLEARFAYDTERNTFFLNMEGMSLATLDEVESIGTEIEKRWAAIGKEGADWSSTTTTSTSHRISPTPTPWFAGWPITTTSRYNHQIATAMS